MFNRLFFIVLGASTFISPTFVSADPFPFSSTPEVICHATPTEDGAREKCVLLAAQAMNAAYTTGVLSSGCKIEVVINDCDDLLKEAKDLESMSDAQ
ncbi:hypothetical protein [Yersinia kristensenii]|uniref:hypothetical protein n=1 Tax=Yersinia kristensenii TaxID=28152 RepID=UPI0011A484B9|nr:hypothetical protein [Yersinia kristensenii]MDR4898407.1 hypothetical protein [Yersinia kristensenii]MDX6735354.1 hypothetical protein [Yersinia kristensenii]